MGVERQELLGGRVVLYRGDCLDVLTKLAPVDAVITDPPYASGGQYRADRIAAVATKYVQTGQTLSWRDFAGDNKDQRSWMAWCAQWLKLLPVRDGTYVASFIDWRQLPALTDAFQWAGLTWRGVGVWDKGLGSRAPHKGYLRHQCEYMVWGTAGRCAPAEHAGPFPGAYHHPVLQRDKHHMTGKPTALMRDLVQIVPEDAVVLDAFMGSGTTGVAAVKERRRFVGIEVDAEHFDMACARIEAAVNEAGVAA